MCLDAQNKTNDKISSIVLYPPSIVPLASIDGPPSQFVFIPVPRVQSKTPLPFCHSQSGIAGLGSKSQIASSMVTVGGGAVIVGYLINNNAGINTRENAYDVSVIEFIN